MPETEENNEQMNPNEGGPFRPGRILGRNKREVVPDPSLVVVSNVSDREGYGRAFRIWFLNHNGPLGLLLILILAASYEVPHHYYPQATNLVLGMVLFAIIGGWAGAYEYEKRQDRSHSVFVDEIQIQMRETTVQREKNKGGDIETKVLVPKFTRRAIYLAKDYMFEGKENDPYRIEKINCQIVGTFGKIIDVSFVDDSGRIIIGEGDGDIPSGLIVKMAYPSRTEMDDAVKKADRMRQKNAIPEGIFLDLKKRVDEYNHTRDEVFDFLKENSIGVIDITKLGKKERSFFVALDKYSMRYWNGTPEDAISLKEWKSMDPSIVLPKILTVIRDYDQIQAERIDLLVNRQSDKLEAQSKAIVDLITMMGFTQEAFSKMLIQREQSLTNLEDRVVKEKKEEIGIDSRPEQ